VLEVDYVHSDVPCSGTETNGSTPVPFSYDFGVNSLEMAAGVTFNLGGTSK
jgi:hypothetical protein